jgi:glyoxylase-like metal-dependent hydrolase (beta-lactamase superfamily II)
VTGPEPPYEVVAVRYGSLEASRGELLRDDRSGRPAEQPLCLDYFFWLVRNENRAVLVDTGFSRRSGEARGRTLLREPAAALAALQGSRGIDAVLLTHLHYDHTGNLAMAPGADVLLGEAERRFWSADLAEVAGAELVEPEDLARLDELEREGRVRLLPDEATIAPGLRARCVGGHTPGQLVLEVSAAAGEVILASDALHFYEELDGSCLFAHTVDPTAARRALAGLRERAEAGATVVPGHDPLVCERFETIADGVFRVG